MTGSHGVHFKVKIDLTHIFEFKYKDASIRKSMDSKFYYSVTFRQIQTLIYYKEAVIQRCSVKKVFLTLTS